MYCLALVPANTLPKTPLGGIHLSETKQLFLEGSLHPCNVLMCPHTCVTNLPKPRQKQPGMSKSQACLRSLRWAWSQWSCLLQVSPPGGVATLPQQFLCRHLCGRHNAADVSWGLHQVCSFISIQVSGTALSPPTFILSLNPWFI